MLPGWVEEGDWLVLPEGTPFEPEPQTGKQSCTSLDLGLDVQSEARTLHLQTLNPEP